MIIIVAFLTLAVIVIWGAVIASFTTLWLGILFIVISVIFFFLNGFKKITANPPHKGILTIWGKRQDDMILDEGLHFFPFSKSWFGFIEVNVTKVNQDFTIKDTMTPDRAPISIEIGLTFTPRDLIPYLDSGGETGVKKILEDIIQARVRTWAISQKEGPETWEEAKAAKEDAEAILLKAILGESFIPIPDEAQIFPTTIWLNYRDKPQKPLIKKDEKLVGKGYKKMKVLFDGLSKSKQKKVRDAIEERRKAINDARRGNANFLHKSLGIGINRLNIDKIKTSDELEKAGEMEAREKQERKGEVFEIGTDLEKAMVLKNFLGEPKNGGEVISIEKAFDIIMTWKATRGAKNAFSFTIPGLSPALSKIAESFLGKN